MKGGYNAWKDAGYPISYEVDGITYIKGSSVFDLVQPIKLVVGQEMTIKGFCTRNMLFFITTDDSKTVIFGHVNLQDEHKLVQGQMVKVRGKITQVIDHTGDMYVYESEHIPALIWSIEKTVDAHWPVLRTDLLKENNLSYPDGAVGYPLFDQTTDEVIIYRNIGSTQIVDWPPQFAGEGYYVPVVNVYYFINLEGKITKIFLEYRQSE